MSGVVMLFVFWGTIFTLVYLARFAGAFIFNLYHRNRAVATLQLGPDKGKKVYKKRLPGTLFFDRTTTHYYTREDGPVRNAALALETERATQAILAEHGTV